MPFRHKFSILLDLLPGLALRLARTPGSVVPGRAGGMAGGFRDVSCVLFSGSHILFFVREYELRDADGQPAKKNDAQAGQDERVEEYL